MYHQPREPWVRIEKYSWWRDRGLRVHDARQYRGVVKHAFVRGLDGFWRAIVSDGNVVRRNHPNFRLTTRDRATLGGIGNWRVVVGGGIRNPTQSSAMIEISADTIPRLFEIASRAVGGVRRLLEHGSEFPGDSDERNFDSPIECSLRFLLLRRSDIRHR